MRTHGNGTLYPHSLVRHMHGPPSNKTYWSQYLNEHAASFLVLTAYGKIRFPALAY